MSNKKILDSELRRIIREELEKSNGQMNSRVAVGYGASHPYGVKKSTKLGQTSVEDFILKNTTDEEGQESSSKPVKVSRAFLNK